MDSLQKLLPQGGPPARFMSGDELQAALQGMWPLYTWPLKEDPDLQGNRWITFDTVSELQHHWRATYYVQVKATDKADVRFKVVMTAAELSAPVIEIESTHLVH